MAAIRSARTPKKPPTVARRRSRTRVSFINLLCVVIRWTAKPGFAALTSRRSAWAKRSHVRAGTHRDRHLRFWMRPCVGQIDHSLGWSAKVFILGVLCYADHFNPPRRNVLKIAESPSKWVVIAEERACQGFAHNGDRRRRGLEVARLKVA